MGFRTFSVFLMVTANLIAQQGAPKVKPAPATVLAPKVNFVDLAESAGLTAKTEDGGDKSKKYIIETTGSGAAFVDLDNDGWPDAFLVNGTRLEGFPEGQEPTSHLYHNNHDGTFTDVTNKSGAGLKGWGQGVCAGDYDNDGSRDLFVTFWGHNILLRNNGDGTFLDVTKKTGLREDGVKWSTGCAFVDYDRDGRLDLFISHYVDLDLERTPTPGSGTFCQWKGMPVMCGPRGLKGTYSQLYHNNGDGTFTDVTEKSGVAKTAAYYCFTVLTGDFDNDGWPDVFVACDSTPSLFFHNNHDGTFTETGVLSGVAFNDDGREQAGMGAHAVDYDGDGWLDIIKTNFSDDTPTLYHNNRDGSFSDVTLEAGLGKNSQFLGWGTVFLDIDNDGWPDIFMANGHVYPEVDTKGLNNTFRERKLLYWNEHDGKFRDISMTSGPGISIPFNSHGVAAADFDNDGNVEILVNNSHDRPSLLKNNGDHSNWILLDLQGTKSNRDAIGARVTVRTGKHQQTEEVRSGGGYDSQSDLRLHFGLGPTAKADDIEIRWPSGLVQHLPNVTGNRIVKIREGTDLTGN
jgi:enediyne biosynthesis protein E4